MIILQKIENVQGLTTLRFCTDYKKKFVNFIELCMKGEPFSPSSREVTPVKHVKMYNFRIKLETCKRSVENDFFFDKMMIINV